MLRINNVYADSDHFSFIHFFDKSNGDECTVYWCSYARIVIGSMLNGFNAKKNKKKTLLKLCGPPLSLFLDGTCGIEMICKKIGHTCCHK